MNQEDRTTRTAVAGAVQTEVAVLAGGCFWGVEEILRAVPGVIDTDVGYTGGFVENPTYEDTHESKSGHAEAIRVTFDPSVLSYEDLLEQWFFKLHDPTTLNRQGNDIGTQYRSAIFFASPEQEKAALATRDAYQERLTAAGFGEITTEIAPLDRFFYAEDYHQQYLYKVPNGYCPVNSTGVSCPVGLPGV
jgi:peptide-methionine (S)-S-oxide reductase